MPDKKARPDICDYEGSNYRTEFWENQGRDYEDRVERIALRRLLPKKGKRLLEIGAGFGRLTDEYHAYEQVVLLDYSFSQLEFARERHGDKRFIYVAADAYRLPFRAGAFDGASMIRTIHHMEDVSAVLKQVQRVLAPKATFIMEYANKRNFKSMLRYALKRQDWTPYSLEPIEFVELNFDFHPQYITNALQNAGFNTNKQLPVSVFRNQTLKKLIPLGLLVTLDSLFQWTGLLYTPSVFSRNVRLASNGAPNLADTPLDPTQLFVCPETGENLRKEGNALVAEKSGLRYSITNGIYDFKAPME